MEKRKNINITQNAKLTPSQRQDKVHDEKDVPKDHSRPNKDNIYDNAESEGLDEDKIVHNGEGLDPEAFDERADNTSENPDKLESELEEEDE